MPWKCPALKATQYLFPKHFVIFISFILFCFFCYRNIIPELRKKVIARKDICKTPIRHNFQLIAQRTVKILKTVDVVCERRLVAAYEGCILTLRREDWS